MSSHLPCRWPGNRFKVVASGTVIWDGLSGSGRHPGSGQMPIQPLPEVTRITPSGCAAGVQELRLRTHTTHWLNFTMNLQSSDLVFSTTDQLWALPSAVTVTTELFYAQNNRMGQMLLFFPTSGWEHWSEITCPRRHRLAFMLELSWSWVISASHYFPSQGRLTWYGPRPRTCFFGPWGSAEHSREMYATHRARSHRSKRRA